MFTTTRASTLALVSGLTQTQLDYPPAPGKWSVGEVLDHVILGQRLNLCYISEVIAMKKAGRSPELSLSFTDVDVSIAYIPKGLLPALELPFTALNLFLPTCVRDFMTRNRLIPAQNPELTNPRRARPAAELRDDLGNSMKEAEALFEPEADLDYDEMTIQHPLLGSNSVPELLRFLALHEQRHQSQISDILANPGFPKFGSEGDPHVA